MRAFQIAGERDFPNHVDRDVVQKVGGMSVTLRFRHRRPLKSSLGRPTRSNPSNHAGAMGAFKSFSADWTSGTCAKNFSAAAATSFIRAWSPDAAAPWITT